MSNEICRNPHIYQFPSDWDCATVKDRNVRKMLVMGWYGRETSKLVPFIEGTIGENSTYNDQISVSIPFITKSGRKVTLFGGWIHATRWISWDCATVKDRNVRKMLVMGWYGRETAKLVPFIEGTIGEDSSYNDQISVSIPFITKSGHEVTLFGGWIHATRWISWDILDLDGPFGDYEDERFPSGLTCLKTVDLIRAIRIL